MKRIIMKTSAVILLLLFAVSAIGQSNAELKQKIEKMNMEMADAMKAGDYERNLALYTDDVVSLPSYDKMLNGKDAIKKQMDEMAKSEWKILDANFETVSVETQGDVITEIGKYKMEMKKEGLAESMKDEGKYLTQWQKQADGSLKIKTEIWNSDKNPWEEMSAMKEMDSKKQMGEKHDHDKMDMDSKENKSKTQDDLRPDNENK
jgi:uncharacterized protein (TIGR02246 family)